MNKLRELLAEGYTSEQIINELAKIEEERDSAILDEAVAKTREKAVDALLDYINAIGAKYDIESAMNEVDRSFVLETVEELEEQMLKLSKLQQNLPKFLGGLPSFRREAKPIVKTVNIADGDEKKILEEFLKAMGIKEEV